MWEGALLFLEIPNDFDVGIVEDLNRCRLFRDPAGLLLNNPIVYPAVTTALHHLGQMLLF